MKIHTFVYIVLLLGLLLLQSGCRPRSETPAVQFAVTTSPPPETVERKTPTLTCTPTNTPTIQPTAVVLSECDPAPLPEGEFRVAWEDRVCFQKVSPQSEYRDNVEKAVDWLKRHSWDLHLAADDSTVSVIAWYDPTLHPGCDPCADENSHECAFAAYLVTDTLWAYKALAGLNLTFDALGFPRHMANFLTIMKRYPDMRAVIDHCMKPQVRDPADAREAFRFWADGISRLALETGAFCKLSGLATQTEGGWTIEDLRPYAEHVLTSFGPERVMWGSDWPVCRLRASYDAWLEASEMLSEGLDADGKSRVFGGTAAEFYRL